MENDYSAQFMNEVHSNMQPIETPKRWSAKKVMIIIGAVLIVAMAIIGAIVLVKKAKSDRQLEQFAEDEKAMVRKTEEIHSDPIFSVAPYYDDEQGFYVDAWGTDGGIIVKVLPLCDPDHYDEYAQRARDWISDRVADVSKYTIVIGRCEIPQ